MRSSGKAFEIAGVTFLFIALTVYHHWNALPFRAGTLYAYRDQLLHTWILGWDAWALVHNPLGIFNAPINYPAPLTLALSDHLLGLLPNWIIGYLLSGDYAVAHNYAFLLTYVVCGLGAYFYFRHANLLLPTAFVGAVFFAFHQHFYLIEEIQLASFGYAFFVFLFLEKFIVEKKALNLALMAAFYIVGFLTGLYFAYMLTIGVIIYIIITFMMDRDLLFLKHTGYIFLALFICWTVLFPTIYPYVELHRAGVIPGPSMEFLINKATSADNIYFLGWVVFELVLGLLLLICPGTAGRRRVVIFLVISLTFRILTLGPYLKIGSRVTSIPLPYHLLRVLPGFESLRITARYHFMAHVGDAFLLASTLNLMLHPPHAVKYNLRRLAGTICFLIISIYILSPVRPMERDKFTSPVPSRNDLPIIYRKLIELDSQGPIVEFPLLPAEKSADFLYQYFSLFHHRRMFNGNSGYTPPGNGMMWGAELSLKGWVEFFRATGIKLIVSHPPDFMAQVVERSWRGLHMKPPPLPPPDPKRRNSVIWMHPVNRAIYMNGMTLPVINEIIGKFNFHVRQMIKCADIQKDIIIIDIGHGTLGRAEPGLTQPLPTYAAIKGDVLYIRYSNLAKMLDELGPQAPSFLLNRGVNRIEVRGFRWAFNKKINNPFYDITEEKGKSIGLKQVAKADGSVIWKIEPKPNMKIVEYPVTKTVAVSAENDGIKMTFRLTSKPGTVWKNPNPYGINAGHIEIRKENDPKPCGHNVQINLPLALPEDWSYEGVVYFKKPLPPGTVRVTATFPAISPEAFSFTVE